MKSWETVVVAIALISSFVWVVLKIRNFFSGKVSCSCENSNAAGSCSGCPGKNTGCGR